MARQRVGLVLLIGLVVAAAVGWFGSPGVILRVVTIYGFLLVVFRVAGKRTVAEMTSFDLIVLLVIGDATQQGLIGDDFSVTTALVAVSCLILIDVALGQVKSDGLRRSGCRRRASSFSFSKAKSASTDGAGRCRPR